MKQIEEMFGRFLTDSPRLKKKWQMGYYLDSGKPFVAFFHYHHLIAIYTTQGLFYKWYETQADLRGFNAINKYMESDAKELIYKRIEEGAKNYELRATHHR